MEHVAIDLGGRESQICIRSSDGTVVHESRQATRRVGEFLKKRPHSRVIVETSAEAFHVADQALECGHEVRVVPAMLVRTLGVGSRGVKTDRRDAQVLSEVSTRIDLPSVHVPSELSRRLRAVCSSRDALVRSRTLLINNTRGFLRTRAIQLRVGGPATLPERVRKLGETPEHVERVLRNVEALNLEIALADKELQGIAKSDAVCRRLTTVPGVGVVTAVRFVATIDMPTRFAGAHALESYLGLTPGERSSSESQHRTGITKAGSPKARWTLVQAAWSALRTRPQDPMVAWALEVARRRGRQVAVTALARKMAGILFALWRDGTTYDPTRGARRLTQE